MFKFWRSSVNIFGLLAMTAAEITYSVLAVKLTTWNKGFFDALQAKNIALIAPFVKHFVLLCVLSFVCFSISDYISRLLPLMWLKKLASGYTKRWMQSQHLIAPKFPNTDQRITEDVKSLADNVYHLLQHFIRSTILLIAFVPVLWRISDGIFKIPGLLVWVAISLSIVSSIGFQKIFGGKLMKLVNFVRESEAVLRSHLMYVGLHGENVALSKGQNFECKSIAQKLSTVLGFGHNYIKWRGIFAFFEGIYNKVNAVLIVFILAPFYLAGRISFGVVTQAQAICFYIADAFSFWPRHTQDIANTITSYKRLKELDKALNARIKELSKIETHKQDYIKVDIDKLYIDSRGLLSNMHLEFRPGMKVMLKGKSGIGKTTFIKALAGLHNEYEGSILYPDLLLDQEIFFSSQAPYIALSQDKLDSIAYPYSADESAIQKALNQVGLEEITEDLNKLSAGQKQRLLFAKVLLFKPKFIFLDEPTASLQKHAAIELVSLLFNRLPQSCIVIISHQDFLDSLFDQVKYLDGVVES